MNDNQYVDLTPVRDSNNNLYYKKTYDIDAINESIKNLFTIEQGTVPGKPWLGNPLYIFTFDNIGYFEERAMESFIRNTIELYEPRVSLSYVRVKNLLENNTIEINVGYYTLIDNKKVFEDIIFKYSHNNITSLQIRKK